MQKKLNLIFAMTDKVMTFLLNLSDRFDRLSNSLDTYLDIHSIGSKGWDMRNIICSQIVLL